MEIRGKPLKKLATKVVWNIECRQCKNFLIAKCHEYDIEPPTEFERVFVVPYFISEKTCRHKFLWFKKSTFGKKLFRSYYLDAINRGVLKDEFCG